MRRVALVLLVFVLSGCARDAYVATAEMTTAGNWKLETVTDRITGAVTPSAMLVSPQASNSAVDFPAPALLQLTCFDKTPVVRFSFSFKIGSDKNTILGYRFDDKPGRDNVESRILDGYTVLLLEDPAEVARFTADLRTSNGLVVRIRSLSGNRTVADFN